VQIWSRLFRRRRGRGGRSAVVYCKRPLLEEQSFPGLALSVQSSSFEILILPHRNTMAPMYRVSLSKGIYLPA
jgi:hypothetical protein